jgi:hypothetical protein
MDPKIKALADRGIVFEKQAGIAMDARMVEGDLALAMDAAYPLVTSPNSGIPAMLSTYVDPKLIQVLVAPMAVATAVGGEVKKGDWTSTAAMFPMVESTGEVTSYGDYENSGSSGVNVQFPQRQPYHFQVMSNWGELEMARAGLAKIDYASQVNIASALALNKFQNKSYALGVSGLQLYGCLNDPALPADLTPNTKASPNSGTAWVLSDGTINATAVEVQRDISKMFYNLQKRSNGLVETTDKMTLIMSPQSSVAMTITDAFNVNVADILKKTYPNLEIRTVPEYATASGEKVQLVLEEYEGQRTWDCAFTEKMRAHAIITAASSYRQKKSAGTWGTIVYRPLFVCGMIGV